MRNRGLGSWIARRARMDSARIALVYEERSWTYGELAADIARLARAMSAAGVRSGDRVGYLGPNDPAYLQAAFASGLLGAVFVPVNHRLAAPELTYIVADAGCSVLFYGEGAERQVAAIRDQTGVREFVAVAPRASVGRTMEELLEAAHGSLPGPPGGPIGLPDLPVDLEDLSFLIYTSGTTGQPKGVMLSHGNITWNALNYLSTTDFRSDDVTLAVAPLYRAGGWGVTLLPTFQKGGTVVLAGAFDPGRALELVARHRVTTLFGGPELLTALVGSLGWASADLSSLRFVISGGDLVHESLIRAYLDRGVPFLQGYGLTEAGPMALMVGETDILRKLGSAGVPPLFVEVRIARGDLSDAPPGERGEIMVRGPNVMRGYWNRPEETGATIVQGWLRTGDVGWMDGEGFVYVVDRLKEMFVSNGENVFPAEVERVLSSHRAVAEAAVVAIEDDRAGHVGVAYVVPSEQTTQETLLAHCRERLESYKVPAFVRFVASLPKNPAGKLLKDRLREDAANAA